MNIKLIRLEEELLSKKELDLMIWGIWGAIKITKDAVISFTVGKYVLERKSRVWIDALYMNIFLGF